MNDIIFNVISYLIEFARVLLVSIYLLDIKIDYKRRMLIGCVISTLAISIISARIFLYDFSAVFNIIAIIILFISTSEKGKIKLSIVVNIGLIIFDMCIGSVIMFILELQPENFIDNYWLYIPVNCVTFAIVIILLLLYVKWSDKTIEYNISKRYILIFIVGVLFIGSFISCVQYIGFAKDNDLVSRFATLGLTVSSIVFVVIAFLLILNKNKNEHLRKEMEINEKLIKSQEEYYTMLLEKEEETKKFRHDIQNHIYCMHTLLKDKEYDELNRYFAKMDSEFKNLKGGIHTGNNLVNAIVNNIKNKYEDVKICWTGNIPANINLSSMDLCTIFSNLLSNAFEAACQADKKEINVSIKIMEAKLLITITNYVKVQPYIVDGNLVSSKKEKNHGYGIKNIRKCVEENNGMLNISYQKNVFTAEVLFYDMIRV
ncbi:MAG: sensor histidine kinase [Eubacterium sp.]